MHIKRKTVLFVNHITPLHGFIFHVSRSWGRLKCMTIMVYFFYFLLVCLQKLNELVLLNPLRPNVTIIKKPVNSFTMLINWLDFIRSRHWK